MTLDAYLQTALDAAQAAGGFLRANFGKPLHVDENLAHDIKLELDKRTQALIESIILDRHPDHAVASSMAVEACFKAGLHKWESLGEDGQPQDPFRPEHVYHYIQFYDLQADFTVDISDFIDAKMASLTAHTSQFYQEGSDGPETVISSKWFWDSLTARTAEWGRVMGVAHAEGFIAPRRLGVDSLFSLR